jgi:hypothetical protein
MMTSPFDPLPPRSATVPSTRDGPAAPGSGAVGEETVSVGGLARAPGTEVARSTLAGYPDLRVNYTKAETTLPPNGGEHVGPRW